MNQIENFLTVLRRKGIYHEFHLRYYLTKYFHCHKSPFNVLTIPWEQMIHKHVRTSDNVDVGDVDKVGNEFIVIRDGVANIHLYYVPKPYITNYDGSSLWIDVLSGLVDPKFERQEEPTQEEIDMLMNEVPY